MRKSTTKSTISGLNDRLSDIDESHFTTLQPKSLAKQPITAFDAK